MEYSEEEIKFLLKPHKLEIAATGGPRTLTQAQDLRGLGCPTSLFQKVLERRAKKLGSKFAEFRSSQRQAPGDDPLDLTAMLHASRIY